MAQASKPTLAVWKFASCDGCQLSLLDLEDELLMLVDRIDIAYFLEASSACVDGPYDVSLVEGSITTAHDAERIREVRAASRALITIGACATAGGIQALRNFADVEEFTRIVYASPDYISTLVTSTAISDHVPVDYELHGCPINKRQLLEVISARAREEGITTFTALMLATNHEMMDVIKALGPVGIVDMEAGTVEIEMPIPKLGLSPTLKKLLRISARNDIVVPLADRH